MSYYREQLESYLKELDVKAGTVFDIGGSQGPAKGRTRSWDVKKYEILDLPHWNVEKKFIGGDGQADLVFCLEVFEYLIDPLTALKNISNVLKEGGRAIVTFAFAYPHHNELDMDSLRYTEPGIQRLADATWLTVDRVHYRRDKSGLLKTFYATDGMRTAKEYPHHDVTGFIVEFVK